MDWREGQGCGERKVRNLANAKMLLRKQDLNGMIKKICSNSRRTHEDKL